MELIIDRTREDVLLGTPKGAYGWEDLNRVEQAVAELTALAHTLDVSYSAQTKTDWGIPGPFSASKWPTVQQMRRYLDNVNRLCAAMEVAAALPVSMEKLTWQGANQIEQALQAVYVRIQSIINNFQFSGELFAGEENRI